MITFRSFFLFIFIILSFSALFADPWGKDADLVHFKPSSGLVIASPPVVSNPAVQWAEKMIRFHQKVISPADGPRSHFIPSSSQYTKEAIQKYGFLKGFIMGCDRLMRENDDPWVYQIVLDPSGALMKSDPVR